jgi:hypothetical protein
VDLAFEETADAAVAAGLAAPEILDGFIYEAKRLGIYAFVDMMEVADPIKKLRSLKQLPDVVILHRPIDVEKAGVSHRMEMIKDLRQTFQGERLLIAVAGGIIPETAKEALEKGADVIIAVDDDNIPLPEYDYIGEHGVVGKSLECNTVSSSSGWFNTCSLLQTDTGRRFYHLSRYHENPKK